MNRPPRRRRRRAFTIPELLFAIGILAIFALAATRLFQATVRVGHAAAQLQDAANTFDSAVAVLRADAWAAPEITSAGPAAAKLGKVTWSIEETAFTRDAGDGTPPRTWPAAKGAAFAVADDGASLLLRVPPSGRDRGGDLKFVSEPLVLKRLTP